MHQFWDGFLHQFREARLEVFNQFVRFLPAQQLMGMLRDQLVEVGGDRHRRLDDGIARSHRRRSPVARDPGRRHAIGRVSHRDAFDRLVCARRVDRQQPVRQHLPACHFGAIQQEAVDLGRQLQVVADVHRRDQETDLTDEFLADRADALDQVAVVAGVDQRDQSVGQFQAQRLDHRHVVPVDLAGGHRLELRCGLCQRCGCLALHDQPAQTAEQRGKGQESQVRHARNQS